MVVRLLRGDCRVTLNSLEAGSIQCAVTSPPYWGLRDYGTEPLVWGGDPDHDHEWGTAVVRPWGGGAQGAAGDRVTRTFTATGQGSYAFCPCGAWLGSLGLEPSPELYVEHLVECFREVWRVLSPTATMWVNLGDSYAGSGNGAHDYRDRATSTSLSLNPEKYKGQSPGDSARHEVMRQAAMGKPLQRVGPQEHTEGSGRVTGYKPKSLMMMPSRLAMALQADGWILRSMMPWVKRSAMPESVTDRPSTAVEYWFLFSKQARYYWDADAVRVDASENTHSRGNGIGKKQALIPMGTGNRANENFGSAINGPVSSRNRRNSDWFFESWQGMLLDDQDEPMALVVNPAGFSGAHFATFPPKLIEPMVKASSRPGDTVLDPFGGAGTTGLVADRLGRNAVLCELSEAYSDLGTDRLIGESPMFTEVVA